MTNNSYKTPRGSLSRRALLAGASLMALMSFAPAAMATDPTGELTFLNWWGGNDLDLIVKLQDAFVAHYPGVTIKNVPLTSQGDARGAIRTALLGGQKADLLIDSWPAFRDELADAGQIRDLSDLWANTTIKDDLSDAFKTLGTGKDGKVYGVTFDYGDRSGMFYRPDTLKKAGVAEPETWDEFVANFDKLNAAKVTPVALPAQYWAHAEFFESMLVRMAGVDFTTKLAKHEVPWTSPEVKATLQKFGDMIRAGGIGDVQVALATDGDPAADRVLKEGTYGYLLLGMWINSRATTVLNLKEGVDYSFMQFPPMGQGHDDTSMVNTDDWHVLANGGNPTAAEAFLVWQSSAEAAKIIASYGKASASNKVDPSLFGPVQQAAIAAVSNSKLQFVIGDLLPGDLVDEYRVQLQKFIQDPSDATIDAVLNDLEAKAATVY